MLLGECSNCKGLDSIHKKLMCDLKSKCKMDVNENLLKVILGVSKSAFEECGYVLQLCLRNGCYIGRGEFCGKDKCWPSSNEAEKLSGMAFQLICKALEELEGLDCVAREPVVLVLDFDIQVCLWF